MGHGLLGRKIGENDNDAQAALDSNIELADKYTKAVAKLGYGNYMANQAYANQAQQNAADLQLATDEAIKDSNDNYEDSRTQQNADVENMGYTPAANDVYAENNAEISAQKAQTAEEIQNQANKQEYMANQQALNQAGGFTNQGYSNAMGAGSTAYGAKTNANNALAAYAVQRMNNRYGLLGSGIAAGGAMGAAALAG